MTNHNTYSSQRKAAKAAGLMYVLIILLGILKVNVIESGLIVPGNDAATVSNIITHGSLFRIGVVSEIIMYVLVVLLSLSLYVILKEVNRDLAFAALFFRFGEAMTGVVITILSSILPLLLINREAAFGTEQLQRLTGLFLGVRIAGLDVVLIFVGLGGAVFCYLFFTSVYVPRVLAAWGVFTYLSMLFLAFVNILFPGRPAIIETVLFMIGALFEVVFGFWLFFKGIDTSGD